MNEGELVGTEVETDCDSEVYSGLRAQDLQEAKDQLLVETADMLHIPLFTAEALLRDNGESLSRFLRGVVDFCLDVVICLQISVRKYLV